MNRKQKKQKQYSNRAINKFLKLLRSNSPKTPMLGSLELDRLFLETFKLLSVKEKKVVLQKMSFTDNFHKLLEQEKVSVAFENYVL